MNEGQNQQQLEVEVAILSKTVERLGQQLVQLQVELARAGVQNEMLGEQLGMMQRVMEQLQGQGEEPEIEQVQGEIVE